MSSNILKLSSDLDQTYVKNLIDSAKLKSEEQREFLTRLTTFN